MATPANSSKLMEKSGLLKRYMRPEVYPLLFMLSVAVGLGGITVYRGLVAAPDVLVSKRRRERLPEMEYPEHTASLSESYIEKSPLRNFARLCNLSPTKTVPSPCHPH